MSVFRDVYYVITGGQSAEVDVPFAGRVWANKSSIIWERRNTRTFVTQVARACLIGLASIFSHPMTHVACNVWICSWIFFVLCDFVVKQLEGAGPRRRFRFGQ